PPVGATLRDERVLHEGEPECVRVSAGRPGRVVHQANGAPKVFDIVGVPDVSIGELPGAAEHRVGVAAQQDGGTAAARRGWGHADLVEVEDLAVEREPAAGPGATEDLDRLDRALLALGEGNAEHPALLLPPGV